MACSGRPGKARPADAGRSALAYRHVNVVAERREHPMPQATFGVFDWIDRGNTPLQQLYEERLQLLEVADSAGFFAYHLAEHHATPLGMAPSPALFLTAAA